jgi:CRP/FNR family transcriptional regulator, cyclic AMP receptor protein
MRVPYGLELHEECKSCSWRRPGFFCDVSLVAMKSFEDVKYTSSYPSGAVLFVEGQTPRGVYLLCAGRVKLAMTSAEGKSVLLRIVEPGALLGLNGTISGIPYEVTAETLEPCQVNFVRREAFLRLIREDREFAAGITDQLCADYRAACAQIRSLGLSRSALEKTARFLLEWAAKGQQTNQGIRVTLPLTQEEIAQAVGMTRESVTRALMQLRHKMLIATKGATLVIRNRQGLEALIAA